MNLVPYRASLTFALILTSAAIGRAGATAESGRITAAANVTLRTMPAPEAPVVAQLPLGTEVKDAGPLGLDKTWVRVRLADAREGWLLANLTKPIDRVWRWPTFDAIIADRLSRKGDGFPAVVELVAFIERVAPEYTDPDGRARMELSRLQALASAAAKIPFRGSAREPYASWLKSRGSEVVYDEPGGRWMLATGPVWESNKRHAASPLADDIAWFAVTTGLGGECEGFLPCYLEVRNQLHGEYLRRHPNGRHADEAVGVLKDTADVLAAPPKPHEAYSFDKARDCRALGNSLDALTAAVKGTHVGSRDAAVNSLSALRKLC